MEVEVGDGATIVEILNYQLNNHMSIGDDPENSLKLTD